MSFDKILEFERALANYTGAPYAIMTDCCTHAIELCLRFDNIQETCFTPFTYLSIPMTMHKLGIKYVYSESPDKQQWIGEYQFEKTRIWDSALRLERNMYQHGQLQCLSFGYGKPLQIGRGGAILLDDKEAYDTMLLQRYDGRNLNVQPWEEQQIFYIGYHYRPTLEEATKGLDLLPIAIEKSMFKEYPDLRQIVIKQKP